MASQDRRPDSISLWDFSAPANPDYPPLEGDVGTEVAIVGGGFTGLSTALHLGLKGVDSRVIEAMHIGYGGSGRNAGLVNAGLWLPPQDVRATMGEHFGGRLINVLGEAPSYVFNLIEQYQIQCEATQSGTIHAAHSPKGYADLARRAEAWERLGAPVDLLSADQAREKIGTDVFYGGLLDHRAGTINPMGYVRGLARAAANSGATIHTGTRALALYREGEGWKLETDRGTVSAPRVVIGTNAYTGDLWPGLDGELTIIHYFQVATEPLGERADSILPGRQGVWDTGDIMFSVRKDMENRLIFGSMGKLLGADASVSRRWARKSLRRLFPHIGEVEWDKAWFGRIAMTPDHIPRIHQLAPNLYTPIGYNGRGITPGTIFGKAMADLATGMGEAELPIPVTALGRDRVAPLRSAVYEGAFKTYRLWKSL